MRVIFPNGRFFEGMMTKDCQINGFGVEFGNHFGIGWWTNNEPDGNLVRLKAETQEEVEEESGYYQDSYKIGPIQNFNYK